MEELYRVEKDMGIYLHIPFCRQKCSYCDFAAYQGLADYYDAYVDALVEEIQRWAEVYPTSRAFPVDTIYFGGGTPTELSIYQIDKILKILDNYWDLSKIRQMSIEANPGEINQIYLQDLHSLGFNRISFGVQTFKDQELILLHRNHTGRVAIEAIQNAYKQGFNHCNLDLIYALPNQTLDDLVDNINIIQGLPIDHISIYGLQLEPGTYLSSQVKRNELKLPNEELEEAMYDYLVETLPTLGFDRYEIANFSKNNQVSYHNLRYWMYRDYLGFGAGAHSFYNGIRRANTPYVVPYINSLKKGFAFQEEEKISIERHMEDYCFLRLRTKWGIAIDEYNRLWPQTFENRYGKIVDNLEKQGLVLISNNCVKLTPLGVKHGNYVFEHFLIS